MKKQLLPLVLALPLALVHPLRGQNSTFEKSRNNVVLDATDSDKMITALTDDPDDAVEKLHATLKSPTSAFTGKAATYVSNISTGTHDIFERVEKGENIAVVLVYRDIKVSSTGNYEMDPASLHTVIAHKKRASDKTYSSYLLETRKIYVIMVDLEDQYYKDKDIDPSLKLANSQMKIVYKTSFFQKSLQELAKTVPFLTLGAAPLVPKKYKVKLTIIEVDPAMIKAPCDVVFTNKAFTSDLSISVHEKNSASFQVGIVNSKYALKNFSFSNDTLTVKGDSTEQASWKSNAYALLELHLPRDIDNFRPIWKVAFRKNPDEGRRKIHYWLYDITLDRIGVYGGVKISKDPLSDLYAGFNYAITKELYLNFGWSWSNVPADQRKKIPGAGNLNNALNYVARGYTAPQFSWGLSFSPSSVAALLGLNKDKS